MPLQEIKEIEPEVTTFLSELIKINTTNPPGNETPAAQYLAKTSPKKLHLQIIESAPTRGSVITRLKAQAKNRGCSCCPSDVVARTPKSGAQTLRAP